MNIKRIAKHLAMSLDRVKRIFPKQTLLIIGREITLSEATHCGEIRFAVEGALHGMPLFKGQSGRERAIEVFSQLRIWDTEYNSGVLIYVLLADRHVEIVADRGIHARVGAKEWEKICHMMETDFVKGNYEGGITQGIQAITCHLRKHFPIPLKRHNDLPDTPIVL